MRILCIDDDVEILDFVSATLTPAGHEVATAATGELGLAAAAADAPDLVLVDLAMPAMDGFEVIRRLKADALGGPFLPVVLFTGVDDLGTRVRGFTAGCDDYLTKPVDIHELKARVHTLLTRRAQDVELRRMNARLRDAQKVKEDLAQLVVHDMRNPLSALAGNIELLEDELAGPNPQLASMRDALGDCRTLTARALALLADLLDVAQLEEGILHVHGADTGMRAMLEAAVHANLVFVKARKLTPVVEVAPDAERWTLDPGLMGRVLENLISNAVRYANSGGRMRLTAVRERDQLVLTIGNDGPAVPEEDRLRIFDKFFRIEERRAAARANRGMGLYFCRLAVEVHGGTITVGETTDFPTTFVIRLP